MEYTNTFMTPVNSVKWRVTIVQLTVPLAASVAVTLTSYTNTSPCITLVLFSRFTMATGIVILQNCISSSSTISCQTLGPLHLRASQGKKASRAYQKEQKAQY